MESLLPLQEGVEVADLLQEGERQAELLLQIEVLLQAEAPPLQEVEFLLQEVQQLLQEVCLKDPNHHL